MAYTFKSHTSRSSEGKLESVLKIKFRFYDMVPPERRAEVRERLSPIQGKGRLGYHLENAHNLDRTFLRLERKSDYRWESKEKDPFSYRKVHTVRPVFASLLTRGLALDVTVKRSCDTITTENDLFDMQALDNYVLRDMAPQIQEEAPQPLPLTSA